MILHKGQRTLDAAYAAKTWRGLQRQDPDTKNDPVVKMLEITNQLTAVEKLGKMVLVPINYLIQVEYILTLDSEQGEDNER